MNCHSLGVWGEGDANMKETDVCSGNRGLMRTIKTYNGQDNQVIHRLASLNQDSNEACQIATPALTIEMKNQFYVIQIHN